jgi:ribosomal protein S18 acetylase RimI-like enzyme
VRLDAKWIQRLLEMLDTVDRRLFHPHPFSSEAIQPLVQSRDEYWLLVKDEAVLGYGMLRGWEEGYAIPSLGIAVAARHRGHGHGERIMHFLHLRAYNRGAARIRLTVDAENQAACGLYRKFGYRPAADELAGAWFIDIVPEQSLTDGKQTET